MVRKSAVFALLVGAAAVSATAAEFPLKPKRMTAEEALLCPGYGPGSRLSTERPATIAREPKAASKRPLYGTFTSEKTYAVPFRVDESKGTGSGYDRLLVDWNGNGDLTDDPVSRGSTTHSPRVFSGITRVVFDPVDLPKDRKMGPWTPRFGALLALHQDRPASPEAGGPHAIGSIGLRAGWYLQATVDLDGVRETIGLVDCNGNLHIGDNAKIVVIRRGLGRGDALDDQLADAILRDRNGNGRIDFDVCENESEPYTNRVCIGSKVYEMSVAADLRSIRLEPYPGPVGEVAIAGHPETIRTVTLAWQEEPFKWHPVTPAIVNGKAVVPAGTYHLFSCVVAQSNGDGTIAMTKGQVDTTKDVFEVVSGKTAALRCGMPLELRVQAERRSLPHEDRAATATAGTADPPLLIGVELVGAGDELYYAHVKGKDLTVLPPPPGFRILDARGNEVASGKFEYG